VRGFVATGLLSAVFVRGQGTRSRKEVLRDALRGGAAFAAAAASADALQRRHYGAALLAIASGVAGLIAIESLLNVAVEPATKDTEHGQEKA
jgi:hypothetical protein